MIARALAIAAALAALAGTARADVDAHARATPGIGAAHADVALGAAFGGGVTSTSVRGFVGGGVWLAHGGSLRPYLGLGLLGRAGTLAVDDFRGLTGTVEVPYTELGPELRLGLSFVDGGYVDSHVYLAAAVTRVSIDRRLTSDPVDGIGGSGRGYRVAVGLDLVDSWARMVAGAMASHAHEGAGDMAVVLALLPDAVEVEVQQGAGSRRYGFTLGWGF